MLDNAPTAIQFRPTICPLRNSEDAMAGKANHLNELACLLRADDCHHDAKQKENQEHRTMLEHIAETWERIAKDIAAKARALK